MANKKQMARAAEAAAQKAEQEQKKKTTMIIASILVVLGVALCIGVAIFAGSNTTTNQLDTPTQQTMPAELTATHKIQIDVQDYGTITAELYGEVAPLTVENFVKLADAGFYDGLTFHRIISGFMIQGGDPLGNGTGGAAIRIKGEFSSNGWDNPILHERGVLSMARSSAPDSASSQFFIMHKAAPHLDGAYAAFGKVLTGMEIVDAICQNTPVTGSNGTVQKANQPIITSIRVMEGAVD